MYCSFVIIIIIIIIIIIERNSDMANHCAMKSNSNACF